MPKKLRQLYDTMLLSENLTKAAFESSKRKKSRHEIRRFEHNICGDLYKIYDMLDKCTYKPSKYRTKVIHEPKERLIQIAPFFPDRIIHHLLINVVKKRWESVYIKQTYACIKGRGIDKCFTDVGLALKNHRDNTKYCFKFDIRKYYNNVDHSVLKSIVRKTIGDERMLWLIDSIIDSVDGDKGLPIGNYTSQYFANLYLAYFDHWVREKLKVKFYFRYMDDVVILSDSKEELHNVKEKIAFYLENKLKLHLKGDYQIFPVDKRAIDFVGYRQSHYDILLRKRSLMRLYRKHNRDVKNNIKVANVEDIRHEYSSEYGWLIKLPEQHQEHIFNQLITQI